MEHRDPDRREDEPTRPARREEKDERERPEPRPKWSRDVEIRRSVNAAVQDADFDR
ncbi:MAG: hypothetical protein ACRDNR_11260 [Gaiellaceae bacterium]